jgi:hypothetical protein
LRTLDHSLGGIAHYAKDGAGDIGKKNSWDRKQHYDDDNRSEDTVSISHHHLLRAV